MDNGVTLSTRTNSYSGLISTKMKRMSSARVRQILELDKKGTSCKNKSMNIHAPMGKACGSFSTVVLLPEDLRGFIYSCQLHRIHRLLPRRRIVSPTIRDLTRRYQGFVQIKQRSSLGSLRVPGFPKLTKALAIPSTHTTMNCGAAKRPKTTTLRSQITSFKS